MLMLRHIKPTAKADKTKNFKEQKKGWSLTSEDKNKVKK